MKFKVVKKGKNYQVRTCGWFSRVIKVYSTGSEEFNKILAEELVEMLNINYD